jgi:hypothetical protein
MVRRCEMGGALEAATRQYLDFVDRKDAEAIIGAGTEDIQGVDEISRRWMRGADELGAYIRHPILKAAGIGLARIQDGGARISEFDLRDMCEVASNAYAEWRPSE